MKTIWMDAAVAGQARMSGKAGVHRVLAAQRDSKKQGRPKKARWGGRSTRGSSSSVSGLPLRRVRHSAAPNGCAFTNRTERATLWCHRRRVRNGRGLGRPQIVIRRR
jgi:hypothetical protein